MTLHQLAIEICKREGKKRQVNIAQVKEILRCLGDICVEQHVGGMLRCILAVLEGGKNRRRK